MSNPFRCDLLECARQARGLTKTELARRTGISVGFISRFEEDTEPTLEQLNTLAETLQFPSQWFYQPVYQTGWLRTERDGKEIAIRPREATRRSVTVVHRKAGVSKVVGATVRGEGMA